MVARILDAILNGASIGYTGSRSESRPHINNLPTANDAPAVITAAIATEVAAGRMKGPYDQPPPFIRVSPVGLVAKKVAAGAAAKYRMIHHLSWPHGHDSSINHNINDIPLSLSTIDDAMASIKRLGRGSLLMKFDIAAAYRCIPVRSHDQPLLGIYWNGQWYMDSALPFGLKSSCTLGGRGLGYPMDHQQRIGGNRVPPLC